MLREWMPDEIEYLREQYAKDTPAAEIAKTLGRTRQAVYQKARHLGVANWDRIARVGSRTLSRTMSRPEVQAKALKTRMAGYRPKFPEYQEDRRRLMRAGYSAAEADEQIRKLIEKGRA